MKVRIYQSGERYVMDEGISIGLHGGKIKQEYHLKKATTQEKKLIHSGFYPDSLLEEISKRG